MADSTGNGKDHGDDNELLNPVAEQPVPIQSILLISLMPALGGVALGVGYGNVSLQRFAPASDLRDLCVPDRWRDQWCVF